MEEIVWSVEERFTFPAIGVAKEAEMIRVTPQWQVENDASSDRLVGVYHIAASLAFDPAIADGLEDDSVEINEVDFDGSKGYFEYAVPFTVDFPKHVDTLSLAVRDVQTAFEGNSFAITWDVACNYKELKPVTAKLQHEIEFADELEEVVFIEPAQTERSVTSAPLIWDLTENYTVIEIKLDQIVRK